MFNCLCSRQQDCVSFSCGHKRHHKIHGQGFVSFRSKVAHCSVPGLSADLKSSPISIPHPYHASQKDITEGYFKTERASIRYATYGHGSRVLFFTYGVLGEIRNSFKKQLTEFDPKMFTSIFWDPPGYGQSMPRDRHFTPYKYVQGDASLAHELLLFLGISKVSLFGWCDGGHMSIIFSLMYPDMVHKLIVWGTIPSLTKDNVRVFERMRHLSNWSATARSESLKAYDNDVHYMTGVFNRYVDMINVYFQHYGGDIFRYVLPHVAAPTLVFHSADDVMMSSQQARDLVSQIRTASLHLFSNGGHSCHIKRWQEFNKISRDFLLK